MIFGEDLIECARGTMNRANISANSRKPCLVPLVIENADDNAPDEWILAEGLCV